MDLAQSLADLRQSLPEGWLRAFNRWAPPAVTAILVVLLARELADITWTALSGPTALDAPVAAATPVRADETKAASPGGYAALTGWRPFGEPPLATDIPRPAVILDAPDTTLNLSLHATHEIKDESSGRTLPELGTASISQGRGEQQLYHVGDTISGGSGARLHSVYFDRVLLDRGGRVETLRLPIEVAASAAQAPLTRPGDVGQQAAATAASSLRDVLSDNAAALTEIIRPTPHMEGGQMIGFRLAPGRNRDAFNALGLQPGDVMTEVNGLRMNDPRAAAQVFSTLSETTVASVTIMRDGTPQVLSVDLSTVESIMENSQ